MSFSDFSKLILNVNLENLRVAAKEITEDTMKDFLRERSEESKGLAKAFVVLFTPGAYGSVAYPKAKAFLK